MKGSKITLLCLVIFHFSTFFFLAGCGGSGSSNGTSGTQSTTPLGTTLTNSIPTLEEERPAVNARINALSQALINKDVEAAALLFSPGTREEHRKTLQAIQAKMPNIAEELKTAALIWVAPSNDRYGQRGGEIAVDFASTTLHISVVKIDGEWFFETL